MSRRSRYALFLLLEATFMLVRSFTKYGQLLDHSYAVIYITAALVLIGGDDDEEPHGIFKLFKNKHHRSSVAVEAGDATKQAIEMVVAERICQIEEWGASSTLYLFELMSILGEEFGELCQAVNESCFQKPKHPERGGEEAILREAVQVAAVAVNVIEVILVSEAEGQRREEDTDGNV